MLIKSSEHRAKKDCVELLMALQRNLGDMRSLLKSVQENGNRDDDEEVQELKIGMSKLKCEWKRARKPMTKSDET